MCDNTLALNQSIYFDISSRSMHKTCEFLYILLENKMFILFVKHKNNWKDFIHLHEIEKRSIVLQLDISTMEW